MVILISPSEAGAASSPLQLTSRNMNPKLIKKLNPIVIFAIDYPTISAGYYIPNPVIFQEPEGSSIEKITRYS
jgi:hypothetical protein